MCVPGIRDAFRVLVFNVLQDYYVIHKWRRKTTSWRDTTLSKPCDVMAHKNIFIRPPWRVWATDGRCALGPCLHKMTGRKFSKGCGGSLTHFSHQKAHMAWGTSTYTTRRYLKCLSKHCHKRKIVREWQRKVHKRLHRIGGRQLHRLHINTKSIWFSLGMQNTNSPHLKEYQYTLAN